MILPPSSSRNYKKPLLMHTFFKNLTTNDTTVWFLKREQLYQLLRNKLWCHLSSSFVSQCLNIVKNILFRLQYCKITQISQLIYDFQILSLPYKNYLYNFCLLYFSRVFFQPPCITCSSLSGRFSSHSPINIIAVASCNYLFRPPRILDCVHKMAPPPGPTSSLSANNVTV